MRMRAIELSVRIKGTWLALASGTLLYAGGSSSVAQSTLPNPVLNTIYPCAAQTGTTIEVTVAGTELAGATKLHFATPGVESKPGAKPGQFMVTIGKDAACGYHDVRVVTPQGISNPRVFAVARLPVAELKAGMKAEAGQVLIGRAVKQDQYQITVDGKKGEALQLLCEAAALDSRMEPTLSVIGGDSREVARMQPGEPLLFLPPTDGTYAIEVHDLMFGGGPDYPFVLAVSKPDASGLEPQLPLRPTESKDVDPAKPVAIEDVYTGWFAGRSKPRTFTFTAKKGEVRIVEVKCARLGLDGDPSLVVEKVDGDKATFIAEANDRPAIAGKDEFDAGWADPSLRLQVKEDGTYRVKLRNLFPTQVPFELSVRPPAAAFELVAIPSEPPPAKKTATTILAAPLWRGGVAALKVIALRDRGFTGAISLGAENLPAGVSCAGGMIQEGKDTGYLCFFAEPKAEAWAGAVRIVGKSGDVTAVARGATIIRPTSNTAKEAIYTRLTQEVPLAVAAADAPVLVEAASAVNEATAGKVSVPLKVTRTATFTDALKLTALDIGDPKAPPAVTIAAKAASGKLELDLSKLKLAPGDHPLVLQTTAKFQHTTSSDPKAKSKEVTVVIHSKPIIVRVK
jgi:hypothetical protein